jgi:hypothetical protein
LSIGKTAQEVLRILANNAMKEPSGKKLKTRRPKMLKAFSRRLANKTVVIKNTVFAFDKNGNTVVKDTGNSEEDFKTLIRVYNAVDVSERNYKEAKEVEKTAEKPKILEAVSIQPPEPVAVITVEESVVEQETSDSNKQEDTYTVEQATGTEVEPKEFVETESTAGDTVPAKKKRRSKKKSTETKE